MKKYIGRMIIMLTLFTGFAVASNAQMVVRVRPAAPVIARPIAPSARHMWIDGNWVWRGGRYVYADGYWILPRSGYRWVPGHWRHNLRGWVWRPGYWRR